MRKWEGFAFGWCAGVITSVDSDGRRTIDKAKVNFFARYDMDPEEEEPVPHVLELDQYETTDRGRRVQLVAALGEGGAGGGAGRRGGRRGSGGAGDAAFLGSSDCAV